MKGVKLLPHGKKHGVGRESRYQLIYGEPFFSKSS